MPIKYGLWLDDIRNPPASLLPHIKVARSSEEAKSVVEKFGMPQKMWLDHDLGGEDTSMVFLKWLANCVVSGTLELSTNFSYELITANPVGRDNLHSFLKCLLREYANHLGGTPT